MSCHSSETDRRGKKAPDDEQGDSVSEKAPLIMGLIVSFVFITALIFFLHEMAELLFERSFGTKKKAQARGRR